MQERTLILNKDQTRETMQNAGIPHVSVAFVSDLGNIYTEEISATGKDATDQPTSKPIFGAASLSKPVFAYLVLKLIESGNYKLDLETKLDTILPFDQFCEENQLSWEKTDKDTIERVKLLNIGMVLSHTTGINLFKQVPIKSQFEPGKGYVYSNLAMYYLQKVIEKLAVDECDPGPLIFQTLAKKYVFDPIGMKHSLFYQEYKLDFMPENLDKLQPQTLYLKQTETGLSYAVLGLDGELKIDTIPWDKLKDFPQDVASIIKCSEKYLPILLSRTANAGHTTLGAASAPNSLYTTAEDYALFIRYWLKDVNKMMQDAFHKPVLFMMERDGKVNDQWGHVFVSDDDMKRIACGLGWDLETNEKGEVIRAYKTGDMNQWRGQAAIDFEKNTVIVYFANSPAGHILADQVITPNIELKHGLNYFFQKFGFARKIEDSYKLALMSEATPPQNGIIYLEATKEGLQVGVKSQNHDGEFEKHTIPWFKLPESFPREPAKIIAMYQEQNKFLPTLLLEGARIEKIDAYLDSQSVISSQAKSKATTESSLVSTHSIFSPPQQTSTKTDKQDSATILVLRKKGG